MRKFYGSAKDDIISYPMIPNMIKNNASKFSKLGDFLMFENTLWAGTIVTQMRLQAVSYVDE